MEWDNQRGRGVGSEVNRVPRDFGLYSDYIGNPLENSEQRKDMTTFKS